MCILKNLSFKNLTMHLYLFLISFIIIAETTFGNAQHDSSITHILNRNQYEKLYPHHNTIYSYENFIAASKTFSLFANEGDLIMRKKELIAFFANIAHETTNGWAEAKGGPYVWGLFYTEEQACKDGHCALYNTAGTSKYEPVAGKSYHGRGPMQLSYVYNYGLAGEELGLPLLQQPELAGSDGIIAFKTALWFWMREQKPKPSCHNVMCGKWQPSEDDAKQNRKPGFGMVINIINGGIECNTTDKVVEAKRKERIGFYKWFARIMDIAVEDDCDCTGMSTYGL